jgi:hypothetical protein
VVYLYVLGTLKRLSPKQPFFYFLFLLNFFFPRSEVLEGEGGGGNSVKFVRGVVLAIYIYIYIHIVSSVLAENIET